MHDPGKNSKILSKFAEGLKSRLIILDPTRSRKFISIYFSKQLFDLTKNFVG